VSIDTRWSAGNAANTRKFAAELVSLAPDVILASGGTVVGTLLQVTSTVPIVFTQTADPVGGGLVAATQPALPCSIMTWAGNGWSYSKRSLAPRDAGGGLA
jgi:ABC-type uncharacterized transport system substrate-binding protein